MLLCALNVWLRERKAFDLIAAAFERIVLIVLILMSLIRLTKHNPCAFSRQSTSRRPSNESDVERSYDYQRFGAATFVNYRLNDLVHKVEVPAWELITAALKA